MNRVFRLLGPSDPPTATHPTGFMIADAVIYMSVPAGIQAAHRTDSHGHRPQNRLTCANQQAQPLP